MKGKRITYVLLAVAALALFGAWRLWPNDDQPTTIVSAATNGCEDKWEFPVRDDNFPKILTEGEVQLRNFHAGGETPDVDNVEIVVPGEGVLEVVVSDPGESANPILTLVDENGEVFARSDYDPQAPETRGCRLVVPVEGGKILTRVENEYRLGGCGEEFGYKIHYNFTPLPTPTSTTTPTPVPTATPTITPTPVPTETPVPTPTPDFTRVGAFQVLFAAGSDRWSGYLAEGRTNFGIHGWEAEGWYDCHEVVKNQEEWWCLHDITTGPFVGPAWSPFIPERTPERIRHPVGLDEIHYIEINPTDAGMNRWFFGDPALTNGVLVANSVGELECKEVISLRVCRVEWQGHSYYVPFINHR